MSVRKIGLRWQVRLSVGGERIEKTLPRSATRADAKALETAIRRKAVQAATGKHSLDDAIDHWLPTAKSLKSYDKDIRYRLEVVREYTGGKALEELPAVAERIKAAGQKEGLTRSSINRYLAILRRVGNLAERWGWTDLPLGRRIVLLPENEPRTQFLTVADVKNLARKADPLVGDMILFAALTGLRRGEMMRLTPESVKDGILILTANTKSGKPRGIPIPQEASRIAFKRVPWKIGTALLRKRFEAARAKAGLPQIRWHDLRHTYASWLIQSGQSLTAVRDLLGHSSLNVTNKYAHLAPRHLQEAVNSLPILGKGVEKIPRKKKAA